MVLLSLAINVSRWFELELIEVTIYVDEATNSTYLDYDDRDDDDFEGADGFNGTVVTRVGIKGTALRYNKVRILLKRASPQ